jgi:hypothetical protein
MPDQTDAPQRKCPYLAGRPPHGSYRMEPSGANVCFARASEEKRYGRVSKEAQATRCFCGGEVYERCHDFASAREHHLELPMFAGKAPGPETNAEGEAPRRSVRRERAKRRHRRVPSRKWLANLSQSTFACICWILLMVVAFWLVRRTM